jgi:predicted nucleic acid-binding protein
MPRGVLLDTGPLVAYLSARDAYHDWAAEQFIALDLPFITCEPVLTEACFIAARNGVSPARVLDVVASGAMQIGLQVQDEVAVLQTLMLRYAAVPMSLADACLVRLAEITGLPICTLDSDFLIYRAHRRNTLDLIAPPARRSLHEP